MSNASAKKLKQAQLPFLTENPPNDKPAKKTIKELLKVSNVKVNSSSDEHEDKENAPLASKRNCSGKAASDELQSTKAEIATIDLTDDVMEDVSGIEETETSLKAGSRCMSEALNRSIDEVIDEVVRKASMEGSGPIDRLLTPNESSSAKKKRRRSKSMSPVPPDAKRMSSDLQKEGEVVSQTKTENDGKEIPTIIISPATPAEKPKKMTKRESILNFLGSPKNKLSDDSANVKTEKAKEVQASASPANKNLVGKKRRRSGTVHDSVPSKSDTTEVQNIDSPATSKKMKHVPDATDSPESMKISPEECLSIDSENEENEPVESDEKQDCVLMNSDSPDSCQSPPASSNLSNIEQHTPSSSATQDGNQVSPQSLTKSGAKKGRLSAAAMLKKEAKEKEKEEKRKLREEQRLAKEKEKMELKRKKDEEKALKEEERKKKKEEEERIKAEKLKEKEEKQREREQKEMERKKEKEKKEEERRKEKEKREEEKRQKELEKQRIEEEKQQAEEERRRKKEKLAENFKSFFKSPARSPSVKKPDKQIGIFAPFQLKQDMMLAPILRASLGSAKRDLMEQKLEKQECTSSYLQEIKNISFRRFSKPTLPEHDSKKFVSLSEDGIEIIDEDSKDKFGAKLLRAKFFSFHDNIRPPYYGTWRKNSDAVNAKNPFKKDEKLFDYEFDSDDEWEDPGDAEDIADSDGEDEGEGNEEDEDDGFFVPHGYLSDDEGINDEGEDDGGVKTDHKLKQKQLEFEASFKRKLTALTPVVIGCVWKDSAESLSKTHREMLANYQMQIVGNRPIEIFPSKNANKSPDGSSDTPKSETQKSAYGLKAVPEEAMHDLICLLHGNALSLSRIASEFKEYWKIKQENEDGPLAYGPMPMEPETQDQDMQESESSNESDPPTKTHLTIAESDSAPASGRNSPMAGVQTTPGPSRNDDNVISKTQLIKKCKEIATYCKKDNINRACWFVHEGVLEKYDLANGATPIPSRWAYVTEVPKIQILIYPQSNPKPLLPTDIAAKVQPSATPNPGINIAKFVSKVSATDILKKSKLKHEREKQQQIQPASSEPIPCIAKFTTDKVSPAVLIEKSAQKIAEEQAIRNKKLEEAAALMQTSDKQATVSAQEGVYVIPTPDAMRTLFKIADKSADVSQEIMELEQHTASDQEQNKDEEAAVTEPMITE